MWGIYNDQESLQDAERWIFFQSQKPNDISILIIILIMMIVFIQSISLILFPLHLLIRIQNFFKTTIMKQKFDKKCCISSNMFYIIICSLLVIQCGLFITMLISTNEVLTEYVFGVGWSQYSFRNKMQMILFMVIYLLDCIIHIN